MSILFDGTNDYAYAEGTPPVTSYAGCTIALWMKRSTYDGGDCVAMLGQKAGDADAANNYVMVYSNAFGDSELYIKDATNRIATTLNSDVTGNWVHMAVVVVSNTERYSYLNGDTANRGGNSGLVSCAPEAFESCYFGSRPDGTNDFNGYIAHVGIWDTALSSAQIESLAGGANPTTVATSNLKMYYPCTSATTPGEDTIGGFDLTLEANAQYSSENPTLTAATTTYLKLLAHSSAASATSVEGVVLNSTRDTVIGEFTGQAFGATLESDQAVLLIDVADISPDGSTLTTSSTPLAIAYNATYTTGLVSCTVVEE